MGRSVGVNVLYIEDSDQMVPNFQGCAGCLVIAVYIVNILEIVKKDLVIGTSNK